MTTPGTCGNSQTQACGRGKEVWKHLLKCFRPCKVVTPSNGACRDKPLPAKGVTAVGHSVACRDKSLPAKGVTAVGHSGGCHDKSLPVKGVTVVGHSVGCRDKPLPAKDVDAVGHSDGNRDKSLPVYRKKLSTHTSVDAGSQNGSDVKKSPLRL